MTEIIGTDLNDELLGTLLGDRILGLDGDDLVEGLFGSDTLVGGNRNDSIAGSAFSISKLLRFNENNDGPRIDDLTLIPQDLGDLIRGGNGNDTIAGGQGDDTIRSGPGDDLIYGGDFFNGSVITPVDIATDLETIDRPPIDDIPFPPVNDGDDLIFAGSGNDIIYGGSGSDTVRGGLGDDVIVGNAPLSRVTPLPLDPGLELPLIPFIDDLGDELRGGGGDDTISGASGADTIIGGTGDDSIDGGIGADSLKGNAGQDKIDASAGNDTVRGGIGDDQLSGGAGNDQIIAGQGSDILIGVDTTSDAPGQLERDTFVGGRGNDRFVLGDVNNVYYDDSQVRFIQAPPANEPPPSYGLITDFELDQDVIQLNSSVDYELREIDLSGDAFGLGIFFDADRQTETGAEQLIGIIQSDDDLSELTFHASGPVTELR